MTIPHLNYCRPTADDQGLVGLVVSAQELPAAADVGVDEVEVAVAGVDARGEEDGGLQQEERQHGEEVRLVHGGPLAVGGGLFTFCRASFLSIILL